MGLLLQSDQINQAKKIQENIDTRRRETIASSYPPFTGADDCYYSVLSFLLSLAETEYCNCSTASCKTHFQGKPMKEEKEEMRIKEKKKEKPDDTVSMAVKLV